MFSFNILFVMQNKLFSYGFMEKLLPLFVVFALFAMCYL